MIHGPNTFFQTGLNKVWACVLQAQALLLEMQDALLQSDEDGVSDSARAAVFAALAAADKALADGADEHLQLLSVASVTQKALCAPA